MTPIAQWLPYVLIVQLLFLALCCGFAVRLSIRPVVALAEAADALNPSTETPPLDETGPTELARAARAFNAMRLRIARFAEERVQILAAISHDLQTPITRMKLRAEMAEDSEEKRKLVHDLAEIETLVKEGLAYARTAHHSDGEKPSRVDIGSLVESLVYDYQDTGKAVTLKQSGGGAIVTRPHALRRVLSNLIDNAIKFGSAAELHVRREERAVVIEVLDRGPGIPEDKLNAVLQPFVRLENSRNRETGGSGLGLAIAQQLALAAGGALALHNRKGGGLVAEVRLSLPTA